MCIRDRRETNKRLRSTKRLVSLTSEAGGFVAGLWRLGQPGDVYKRQVHTYLEDCWHWAAARSQLLNGSRLASEALPAVTLCEDCGSTYATVEPVSYTHLMGIRDSAATG